MWVCMGICECVLGVYMFSLPNSKRNAYEKNGAIEKKIWNNYLTREGAEHGPAARESPQAEKHKLIQYVWEQSGSRGHEWSGHWQPLWQLVKQGASLSFVDITPCLLMLNHPHTLCIWELWSHRPLLSSKSLISHQGWQPLQPTPKDLHPMRIFWVPPSSAILTLPRESPGPSIPPTATSAFHLHPRLPLQKAGIAFLLLLGEMILILRSHISSSPLPLTISPMMPRLLFKEDPWWAAHSMPECPMQTHKWGCSQHSAAQMRESSESHLVTLRNGILPVISLNKGCPGHQRMQPSNRNWWALRKLRKEKNPWLLIAIRRQPLLMVNPEETQMRKYRILVPYSWSTYQRNNFHEPRFLQLPLPRKALDSLRYLVLINNIFWWSDYLPFVTKLLYILTSPFASSE